MSPDILDTVRPHLGSFQKILEFLKRAIIDYEGPKHSRPKHESRGIEPRDIPGTVADLSDEHEENEKEGTNQDGEHATGRRVSFASRPSMRTLPREQTAQQSNSSESLKDEVVDFVRGFIPEQTVCSVCKGRGGPEGSGYLCFLCKATGFQGKIPCVYCWGFGRVFAEESRCQNCNILGRDMRNHFSKAIQEAPQQKTRRLKSSLKEPPPRRQRESSPGPSRPRIAERSSDPVPSSHRSNGSRPGDMAPYDSRSSQSPYDDELPPPYASQDQFRARRRYTSN
jgi:hypothetical protein